MDVAIFGAGIAGLMSAISLRAHGHRCHIYERTNREHETGMGFILVPEGLELLRKFGVDVAGVPLHRYLCRSESGEILHEYAMPAGARSVRRADLVGAAMSALSLGETSSGETLSFEEELDHLEFDAGQRVVAALLKSGVRVKADLYVAADGSRSRARQALFPGWDARAAQVTEIVGLIRSDEAVQWAGQNFNKFHANGGGLALGIVPVTSQHVVWYMQFDIRRFPPPQDNADARKGFAGKLVGGWAYPISMLLDLTDFAGVHLWNPVDTDVVPSFHQGNLVLVGDAAHPLSPFTSQGVSSAIADAVALARFVDCPGTGLDEALAAYSAERHAQCQLYLAKGRELASDFLDPEGASSVLLPIAQ